MATTPAAAPTSRYGPAVNAQEGQQDEQAGQRQRLRDEHSGRRVDAPGDQAAAEVRGAPQGGRGERKQRVHGRAVTSRGACRRDPGQRGEHVLAERRQVVAAFLDGGDRAERADQLAGRPVRRGAHLQRALGVGGGRVHAERQHDRLCAECPGVVAQPADRVEPGVIAAAGRQRDIAVGSGTGPVPALIGEAHVVREPASAGVDMDAPVVDVGPSVEDRLRAVAVVGVDVQHGDALGACAAVAPAPPRPRC